MADHKNTFHSFGINHVLNASTNGMLLFEKQGQKYLCAAENTLARHMIGLDKLSGSTWQSLADAAGETSIGGKSHAMQSPTNLDFEGYFAETDTWCKISNAPIDDDHFLCNLTDITRYKQIEAKEEIVLGILRDAEIAVQFGTWIWYPENELVEWSEGLYKLLGYDPKQANRSPATFDRYIRHVHPEDLDRVLANMPEIIESLEPNEIEYRLITRSGEEKHVQSRSISHPATTACPMKLTGCIVDVTSIKQVRNQLIGKVEELNRSNSDLEQFAYVASHDLQEPLRKIVSFGERLEKKGKDTLDAEMSMYLDRILNATRRMQSMVSNLLDFSRLTRTQQEFEDTDLDGVAKGVLGDLELMTRRKNARVELDKLPTIRAIPSQMAQLFQNLFSNSLKFTDEKAQPIITVMAEELSASERIDTGLPSSRAYVRLTFKDNGIGFDDADAQRIFTIFQRLRGRSEYEGAGIGLSVCKKVVENHGGIITASGQSGTGATFTIILPLSQTS